MLKSIDKTIKEAIGSRKFKCGQKQALQSIKGSKLIVISRSADHSSRLELEEQAKSAGVSIQEFDGNSIQLGKLCGKPFRVSVVSFKAE
ncbi:MAG TPA: ribosomal L7Ae/L30e/S12e/Gadd45 family protein [Candidatus Bathyarchaeia archaeon]|jgi:large subunit ribosomal protein L30e|nr:ribosomal L7Ae/L30e/S12e/Gadd45 family protein [Candidatus Bathyarchaeia archaeon]